ncbi:MAG: sigma-70 family RNA polymerase sigma factor [Corynebacteriales bacterium]|nr:sigma-70 family RNA polymerase sigma factor [Mycobacteriales bacterium]
MTARSVITHDRDTLVQQHLGLVSYLARRFTGRGEPLDDLVQVGTIGLLKAVDRFDPERGVAFATYATPTILGELRHHLRDRAWAVRIPRQVQENAAAVGAAISTLSTSLQRAPTVPELAEYTELEIEAVLAALDCAWIHEPTPIDDVEPPAVDDALERVEQRAWLRPLLNRLDTRERAAVVLRFMMGMTQTEIAGELGISQMHVSRLLSRALAKLRSTIPMPRLLSFGFSAAML